jgi:hypothetical protein
MSVVIDFFIQYGYIRKGRNYTVQKIMFMNENIKKTFEVK